MSERNEPVEKDEPNAAERPDSVGYQIAIACWLLFLLFFVGSSIPFVGSYLTLAAFYLMPLVALAGILVSAVEMVRAKRRALAGFLLSFLPPLLLWGAIEMMTGGSRQLSGG